MIAGIAINSSVKKLGGGRRKHLEADSVSEGVDSAISAGASRVNRTTSEGSSGALRGALDGGDELALGGRKRSLLLKVVVLGAMEVRTIVAVQQQTVLRSTVLPAAATGLLQVPEKGIPRKERESAC